jgi:hypothetical protein
LNNEYCSFSDEEMDNFFEKNLYSQNDIEGSWERIFDLRGCADAGWGGGDSDSDAGWGVRPEFVGRYQATFERLDTSYLKSACPFTAR